MKREILLVRFLVLARTKRFMIATGVRVCSRRFLFCTQTTVVFSPLSTSRRDRFEKRNRSRGNAIDRTIFETLVDRGELVSIGRRVFGNNTEIPRHG